MRRSITLASLFLAVSAHVAAGRQTADRPMPAPTIFTDLTSFADLTNAFNQDAGTVRIVALLSPSCGYCIKGYRYMQKLLADVPDEHLRLLVVWEPMLSGDSQALAERMSRRMDDPRVSFQGWDEARLTGTRWDDVLGLGTTAWDVYLVYDAGATWERQRPTEPAYWQHQLGDVDAPRLDYDSLRQHVVSMLEEVQ